MAATLQPGRVSPQRAVPAHIARPEYVGRRAPRGGERDIKDDGDHRGDARRRAARRPGAGRGRQARRAGRDHRRAGPGRARVPVRPRRLPEHARLPRLPEVAVHVPERGHLPRHTGRHGDLRRRHRQCRHHRFYRRSSWRHERDVPGRRRGRGVPAAGGADARGDDARHPRGGAGPPAQRHRPGDRVVRAPVRLRGGPGLHRARDRPDVPLRPGRAALRRSRRPGDHGARHDVHDRADAHARHHRVRHLAGRLDSADRGRPAHRPVRAHARSSPATATRSSPCRSGHRLRGRGGFGRRPQRGWRHGRR